MGGVGPHAGIDLHLKIINNTIASCDQDHVSVYHISNSHAITDRTVYLRNTSTENLAYAIINIINMLHSLECKVIGIPCNTAHAPSIMNVIQEAITRQHKNAITVVHMIEAVAQHIIQQIHQGACGKIELDYSQH